VPARREADRQGRADQRGWFDELVAGLRYKLHVGGVQPFTEASEYRFLVSVSAVDMARLLSTQYDRLTRSPLRL
jgi:hypothetical protein